MISKNIGNITKSNPNRGYTDVDNCVCLKDLHPYDFKIKYYEDDEEKEVIPYTFEDAIALSNIELFRGLTSSTGMIKKMHDASLKDSVEECVKALYEALDGEKAKMALDLLYDVEPEKLKVPTYIDEGLKWLEKELKHTYQDFVYAEPREVDAPQDLEVF
ncbi:hypothetical protein [Parashewanella curva]|uniref:hypothetical protein n=1 Tax=Parashewanella curva TaxID=2338552 RepID=UPI001059FE00|nr:hypothetical protein [Parashewanella curva]